MNLRHLRSFVAVAEEGSFTKAARRVGVAQPSLSQQIRALESDLGGALVERLPRGIRLTSAGKALLPEAQAAVRAAERATAAARTALDLEGGELEVATLLSMAVGIIPHVAIVWLQRYPEIAIRLREYAHRSLLEEEVKKGVGDIAIGPRPASWEGALESLGWEDFVVVLPPSDPLALRGTIRLEELADRQWIGFAAGHGLADWLTAACRRAGFQPRIAIGTTQVEAAARLAASGLGPAMVPDNVVSPALETAIVRLDPPVRRELAAYARNDWTPLSVAFLQVLRDSAWARDRDREELAV